ncbi:MAG: hypothetical protein QOE89_893, partial [Pseudonocardiales bacterium]|nr:hypothetical protein [Pseudonocardiales bacterium]
FKTTLPPSSSDVADKTTIKYPEGEESAAKALQAQVPDAVVTRSADVKTVTLVLGNNGVQVKSLMPAATTSKAAAPTAPSVRSTSTMSAAQTGCIN